jgi:hypothetical protein
MPISRPKIAPIQVVKESEEAPSLKDSRFQGDEDIGSTQSGKDSLSTTWTTSISKLRALISDRLISSIDLNVDESLQDLFVQWTTFGRMVEKTTARTTCLQERNIIDMSVLRL